MLRMIKKIIQYPRVTQVYPKGPLDTGMFRGTPEIDSALCTQCDICLHRCPTGAIVHGAPTVEPAGELEVAHTSKIGINYDTCIFCNLCVEICPNGAAKNSSSFELAKKNRRELRQTPFVVEERDLPDLSYAVLEEMVEKKINRIFGRSLHIREVDAGSCNACDLEINALNNPVNDLSRLGMNFVASPRHADMLLVTGTATRNMELALVKTLNATPEPRLVVAVGACACSGGIFRDSYATRNGIDGIVPVDVYVPGCPPRPQAVLYGILKALDRI
jgi:Ni,Fe-hydrogenase III small subunit/formate hydrogenlyase subunit 6/NADH:ubiquinone oxidoreductase subunit I